MEFIKAYKCLVINLVISPIAMDMGIKWPATDAMLQDIEKMKVKSH